MSQSMIVVSRLREIVTEDRFIEQLTVDTPIVSFDFVR
jgi:hypothetical protein